MGKFISSLIIMMIICIISILSLGLILKCDHDKIIEIYTFQPENSTALSYSKSICDDCRQRVHLALFSDTPSDERYIDVIEEHCEDKTFVKGEYDTIKATVTALGYGNPKTKILCSVSQDDVIVYFSVKFKEECVSSLAKGDEITFYGKSALKGLSWTDCELIMK